jgi:hypothetical protein
VQAGGDVQQGRSGGGEVLQLGDLPRGGGPAVPHGTGDPAVQHAVTLQDLDPQRSGGFQDPA